MSLGYSGTPLVRKLGIREGHRVAVLGDPGHADDLLADLPPGGDPVHDPPDPGRALRGTPEAFDVVVAFTPDAAALPGLFHHGARLLAWDGGLWIVWPKQSSALHRDLSGNDVRGFGVAAGWVDNKVCAVDADWSGLRFVVRVRDRR